MGLDITAYRGLRKANDGEGRDPKYPEEADYDNGWHQMWVNPDFHGREDSIEHKSIYHAEDHYGFLAGSYSGYNEWRDELANLAGYPGAPHPSPRRLGEQSHAAYVWEHYEDLRGKPFVELIHFSDCEGVIGPETSAKLARDFAAFQEKADQHPDEYFRRKYNDWRKAFEMAADNGAVMFH